MAVYAIGDVQGCADQLEELLPKLDFDPARDRLWFVGDLVNRGPRSLDTLRRVKALGDAAVVVLGNHDLHLLAIARGGADWKATDAGLHQIIEAPDREALLDWLQSRPLMHHDAQLGVSMLHAGLPPQWTLHTALACAHEVEARLRGHHVGQLFAHMYGNEPAVWHDELEGWDRLRARYAGTGAFVDEVLGYGADVVVLEPDDVRKEVVDQLQALVEATA